MNITWLPNPTYSATIGHVASSLHLLELLLVPAQHDSVLDAIRLDLPGPPQSLEAPAAAAGAV